MNEYKTLVTGLNKRAKSIIQLKPRNPTTSIKGKLPVQAVCDFKQQEVRTPAYQSFNHLSMPSLMCVFINRGLCYRSLSIKEMSVRSSTTHSPSSGRFWTALDTRRWCPLSASWYLQSTRRPRTVCPGENTVKQNKMSHLCDGCVYKLGTGNSLILIHVTVIAVTTFSIILKQQGLWEMLFFFWETITVMLPITFNW